MKRYQFDSRGYFIREIELSEYDSYPTNTTTVAPPNALARWDNTQWHEVQEIPPKPVKVPQTVSRMQALVAMKRAGILGQVRSIFTGKPGEDESRIKFEEAAIFERGDNLINAISEELDLTEQQLDNLFIEAASIS